jgi:exonuclease SbcC
LCGPNGHGKSALLDAITWCLWGKARGKTQDELISYGADETSVELDFLARNTHYRALRSHARGGGRRRQGVTDFQLQVVSSEGPQPITGNLVRETQAKIDQITGMDYDSFTNSAFLLQGRADEFTNKTPAERKAVLAKILGLELYDRLQDRARERLSLNTGTVRELEGALGEMRRQAEAIGDPTEQLALVRDSLSRLEPRLAQQVRETGEIKAKAAELERRIEHLEEVRQNLAGLRQEIGQLEAAEAAGRSRIQQLEALLAQGDSIRQSHARLEAARSRFEVLEGVRQSYDELMQAKMELERTIETARARLETRVEQLRRRVEVELPARAQSESDLAQQRENVQAHLKALEQEEQAIASGREQQLTLSTRIGEAQSVSERYRAEGLDLRAKLELLRNTRHQDAFCPLCQTPLGQDGCARLADTYETDIAEKRRLFRLNAAQLKQLEADGVALENEFTRRERSASQSRRQQELKLGQLDQSIHDAQLAKEELKQASGDLELAEASLASGDFAAEHPAQLKLLQARTEVLGYDEEERRQAYVLVQELQPFADQLFQLNEAESNLPRETELAAQTREMLRRRQGELERIEKEYRANQEAVPSLPQWQAKLKLAEETQENLESLRQDLLSQRGRLEDQEQRVAGLTREITRSENKLSGLLEDRGVYQELVTAFGRQGVQAMLIETVVPRLEEEANNLLGRMTDNRMFVNLNTQRERRTGHGEPIETLEIQVSDELGPRSYEMYSGGEAFRINLALRIALSKVLAQRTGAPLPTLFIDEGFGTQDSAGRERILDVIAAIQDDFDKIIVITHLDELKDMFPVRIEVQKDEHGSTFWLS